MMAVVTEKENPVRPYYVTASRDGTVGYSAVIRRIYFWIPHRYCDRRVELPNNSISNKRVS